MLSRRTPLQRTAMRRREKDPEREPQRALPAPTVRPLVRGTYGGSTSGVAVPKGPPARPGKGTATKDEQAWMDAIVAYGCIACRMEGLPPRPAAVHHILRGGQRMGHKFTLPLCDPGHHQGGAEFGFISRHPWKTRFEERYGQEFALLATLQGVLKLQPDGSYAP